MLPKHPDMMSDTEILNHIKYLVSNEIPKSIKHDYKGTLEVRTPKDKRELAKDVSSFANEIGGTIYYGIPEEEKEVNGKKVIIPAKNYGIDSIPGIKETLENILVDTVLPKLPELWIKEVKLDNPKDKVVYIVWHPESWEAPHMVHAYKDKRFYRRGNFRAVPMEEHEVERLYLRRQSKIQGALEFIRTADFGGHLLGPSVSVETDRILRLVVCPQIVIERVSFNTKEMRLWLLDNPYLPNTHRWVRFLDGVRFNGLWGFTVPEPMEVRTFSNAAVSYCLAMEKQRQTVGLNNATMREFMEWVAKFYTQIGLASPVIISVLITNAEKIIPNITEEPRYVPSSCLVWDRQEFSFREIVSAREICKDPKAILDILQNRFLQAFGIW
jgi:hypothetical protein